MAPPAIFPEGMGPPDGGYGWVVAAAYALNNIIIIPLMQNFGLIFRDLFNKLELTGTDTAVIMNVNNAFGLALGLFNGPLLRRFSYRKVAIFGSLLVFAGVVLTSFARSFVEFLIFYGVIMSAGQSLTMTSFSYAINTYFRKRRSMAIGFAMTAMGLGPVIMPLLISLAMKEYGARNTALLFGALSLHSFAGALLLQPVRWHLIKLVPEKSDEEKEKEKEMEEMSSKGEELDVVDEMDEDHNERTSEDRQEKDEDGEETEVNADSRAPMLSRRRCSTLSHKSGTFALPRTTGTTQPGAGVTSVWASMVSIDGDALGGSMAAINGPEGIPNAQHDKANGEANGAKDNDVKDIPMLRRWGLAVVTFFDLDLLRDPTYVNIMLGISLAVFAEINFAVMTPFILGDRHFNTQQTATLMSTIAISDIVFRFLAPFIKRACKQPVRVMYMIALALLIGTRTVLIFCYSYESLIGVMVALGVAKGLRTVFWVLVIPDYVPIERLPSANGLQSVTNGLIFVALGPVLGVIRDKLGDYNYVIMALNSVTCITICIWTAEFTVKACRRRQLSSQVTDVEKS